jgi:lipopolysaccharide biosynthesis regulator YciM
MAGLGLLWLLLPVAAASGWWMGRRSASGCADGEPPPEFESQYFRGINHLLNEQPDQAVDVFIELLEVGPETAETHLALGGLYRRRGEMDRAIRIHQNLIAQPELSADHKGEALLELAQDYQSAGLLDRAETIFRELADSGVHRVQALRQLIDVYEHQSDWSQAIAVAHELQLATGNQLGSVIAHYHCEVAEAHRRKDERDDSYVQLDAAIKAHPSSVRASLLEGDMHLEDESYQQALAAYRRVELQDPAYIQEVIPRISECFAALGDADAAMAYLSNLVEKDSDPAAALALSEMKLSREGSGTAREFLLGQLRRRLSLRGLHRLLELEQEAGAKPSEHDLKILRELSERLIADRPSYQCQHCGFPARSLHWQCPSCKHWNTVQPKTELDSQ